MVQNSDLISVIVITYNSSEFVLETLESIKNQTYKNIELIISDDCSEDNTLEICKTWLHDNEKYFLDSKILEVSKNEGIPANCNKAVEMSRGKWIKLIAGDDLLMPECISDYYNFVTKNPEIQICVSDMYEFIDGHIENTKLVKPNIYNKDTNLKNQFRKLLKSYFGNSPTYFICRKVFADLKYDESIPYMEDYPFSLNAVRNGYFIYYYPQPTVLYRIRDNSSYNPLQSKIFSNFYRKSISFDEKYRYPYVLKINLWFEKYIIFKKDFFEKHGLNRNRKLNKKLFQYIDYLHPLYWLNKIL